MGDEMRSLKNVLGDKIPVMKEISSFCCIKCKRESKTFEFIQTMGPQKNQLVRTTKDECICKWSEMAEEELKLRKLYRFNRYSEIPEDLKQVSLGNYEPKNETQIVAIDCAMEYVETFKKEDGRKLLFFGPTGIGKSHLSVSIHKYLLENEITSMFFRANTILDTIKATWDNNIKLSETDFYEAMRNVDVLIIDDLGAENTNDWSEKVLFEILNSRLSKPTIFTSNLAPSEIASRYSARIVDRVFDKMEKEDVIKLIGQSNRRKFDLSEFD